MLLQTRYVTIRAGEITVEGGGTIDGTGSGFPAGQGPGGSSGSAGGSYASAGGNAAQSKQYGSLFTPQLPGSGGGGGAGGSWLEISTGGFVHVDGSIKANGIGNSGWTSGGGSGGTIIIRTLFLKGYGSIESIGGTRQILRK